MERTGGLQEQVEKRQEMKGDCLVQREQAGGAEKPEKSLSPASSDTFVLFSF